MNSLKRILIAVLCSLIVMVALVCNDYSLLDNSYEWRQICVVQDKSLLLVRSDNPQPTDLSVNGRRICVVYR